MARRATKKKPAAKVTKAARVDPMQLRRVRRFLGARTDSEAIAKAIEWTDEARLLHEFVEEHGGRLSVRDWQDLDLR